MDQADSTFKKIMVCGHRNPDVDSIMSAYALADLKNRLGDPRVQAICPGLLPSRAAWIFKHFDLEAPPSVNDVYLRVGDLATTSFKSIPADATLFDAVQMLEDSGMISLPVTDEDGLFRGMLNPVAMLSELMNITSHKDESLAGRALYSSPLMMQSVLEAECLNGVADDSRKVFNIFVAATSAEAFEERFLRPDRKNPVVIVGDRPRLHRCVVGHGIPVLIVTGNCELEDDVIELASKRNVTILRTRFDSATVIRRIKFSKPVCHIPLENVDSPLRATDIVHEIRRRVLASPENSFPVCAPNGKLVGLVSKNDFTSPPPFAMILVDHNEITQGIAGLEELPVLEVVDHHRIAIRPTSEPIKYTSDTVGSTCTIVAGMYRAAGLCPSPKIAGILLSGIVTDTLLFQSPTTTETDWRVADWLEEISGENPNAMMEALMKLDSPLAVMSMDNAIESDRKTYVENGYRFALSQLEENNLELLHRNRESLSVAMRRAIASDALDFMALMVTDPVGGNSELLFVGDEKVWREIPYLKRQDGIMSMPGVLSRKKQLLPQVLATLSSVPKIREERRG